MKIQSNFQNFKDVFCSPQAEHLWYTKILDSINDGILVADETDIVRYVNAEYTRITGVINSQIVGRPLASVRPGAMLPQVIQTGKSLSGVYRREGKIEYVVDMAPIFVDGKIVGGVSVVKDITEVQKLSEEVKKYHMDSDRLKTMVDRMYRAKYTFADIEGNSAAIAESLYLAKRAARGEANVLISGESGTGKEVFAQAIHNASSRSMGPFVVVNCAAIAPSLIESELFGYEEGSFTGAKKGGRMGLFEISSGGTIFLDEIAELSIEIQAKLLRVIQERTVRRIGEANENAIDIRVIAATNKNLHKLVQEGKFRDDLYYRLDVLNIHLPPIRDRGTDIALIADKLIRFYSQKLGRNFHADNEIMELFSHYNWPGNIRELRNAIEYAVNMCDNGLIMKIHLPEWIQGYCKGKPRNSGSLANMVQLYEKKTIQSLMEYYGSGIEAKRRIAKDLGISLATLYNKLKEIN